MIHKLEAGEYDKAETVLASLEIHLAVKTVLEGSSPGEIFIDDRYDPKSAFVWTLNRTFLAGTSENTAFNTAVKNLFDERIYPESLENGRDGFSLYYAPESWGENIREDILNDKHPIHDHRQYFRFKDLNHDWRTILPEGFSLRLVDRDLLENKSLENLGDLVEEMQSERPSVEAFLDQSFGYCVIHEAKLVAWCLSEYNHGERCELGIETQNGFQRMGLATITASALVEHALAAGISAIGWHSFAGNKASIRTAQSVGFEKVCDYPAYWALFDETLNLAVNGNICFERQAYREAVKWYQDAIGEGEVPMWVYWNTACANAYLDQKEDAFNYLNEAVEQGFTDFEFIQTSKHFLRWHETEEWTALLNRLKAR